MNEFEIVSRIDRPVHEVFAFVENVENIPLYNPSVRTGEKLSADPVGVGSRLLLKGKFLGRSYETTMEVTDYKRDELYAMRTISGPFHLEISHTFEQPSHGSLSGHRGGSTKVTSLYRGESHGFFKLAEPVVVRITRKQFEAAAETVKELLEAEVGQGA